MHQFICTILVDVGWQNEVKIFDIFEYLNLNVMKKLILCDWISPDIFMFMTSPRCKSGNIYPVCLPFVFVVYCKFSVDLVRI